MIKPILKYPDERLNIRSEEVDIEGVEAAAESDLCIDLLDTMRHHKALGLSAIQINIPKRVLVYRNYAKEPSILVNPEVVSAKGTATSRDEGCLSVPNFRADIKRAKVIKVEAYDEYGSEVKIKANGAEAMILQHEIDHLNGILLIDKVKNSKQKA